CATGRHELLGGDIAHPARSGAGGTPVGLSVGRASSGPTLPSALLVAICPPGVGMPRPISALRTAIAVAGSLDPAGGIIGGAMRGGPPGGGCIIGGRGPCGGGC